MNEMRSYIKNWQTLTSSGHNFIVSVYIGKNHLNFISVWSEIMSLKSEQLELGFSIPLIPKLRFRLAFVNF